MEVIGLDVKPNHDAAEDIGWGYAELADLLARADVISLHVPLNDKTRHQIGRDEFETMERGAILINTARGGVVNQDAMLQAVADGTLGAAGLDVLPEEPAMKEEAELLRCFFTKEHGFETQPADHNLLHMNNVIVTPHSAFDTTEAVKRILDTTLENINAFIERKPQNVVNN